jgi:hypothetical protein
MNFKSLASASAVLLYSVVGFGQPVVQTMLKLPDTGEITGYTATFGEDNDFMINVPNLMDNGDGTVTDSVTGLMWQKGDGGEMTYENAVMYADTLTLAGYTDWRLPDAHESFSILNHQHTNPAFDPAFFPNTSADYWWTSTRQVNDSNKIWVTNAGGGVGNHLRTETISAGGTKRYQPRAVRQVVAPVSLPSHFMDNGNGTITDRFTQLVWQQVAYPDSMTWEDALHYADTLVLGGRSDWRLPNVKEIQSINDEQRLNPSINTTYFVGAGIKQYWSSTTLPNQTTKAWYLDTRYGITTYQFKTAKLPVLLVAGDGSTTTEVAQVEHETTFTVSPVPFTDHIHVSLSLKNALFKLMDGNGQVVFSGNSVETTDFSFVASGIYFLYFPGLRSKPLKIIKL